MKRYEGLFIFHNPPREEAIKEIIDRVSDAVTATGGRVETVQKMDRKPFARVTDKKVTSGFYANVIFEADPAQVSGLRARLAGDDDVYRLLITEASNAPAAVSETASAAQA